MRIAVRNVEKCFRIAIGFVCVCVTHKYEEVLCEWRHSLDFQWNRTKMLALLNATLVPFARDEATASKTDPVLLLCSFNMPKAANETLQTTKWLATRWFLLRASVLHSLFPMVPIARQLLKRPLDG